MQWAAKLINPSLPMWKSTWYFASTLVQCHGPRKTKRQKLSNRYFIAQSILYMETNRLRLYSTISILLGLFELLLISIPVLSSLGVAKVLTFKNEYLNGSISNRVSGFESCWVFAPEPAGKVFQKFYFAIHKNDCITKTIGECLCLQFTTLHHDPRGS